MAALSTSGSMAAPPGADRDPVRIWLLAVALLVALMVSIGGATRLTGSGLSITEWQPIMGAIPPLTEPAWQDAFAKYQQIPQYHEVNRGMSLGDFKEIYWWEWSHRLLGRIVGFAFAIPFFYFLATGRVGRGLAAKLGGLLVLGGLQGFIGWYMVKSGLVDRISVSQYRLALHLGLAVVLFGLLLWIALGLGPRQEASRQPVATPRGWLLARWIVGLVFLQVLLGALVAGLKAGLTYNTWPLMDGALVPDGLALLQPLYLNLFENPATVQFNHRLLAYIVTALVIWQTIALRRDGKTPAWRSALVLAHLVLLQVALGIWTLLAWVPLHLGLAHQAGAVAVFAGAIWHVHVLSRAPSSTTPPAVEFD
jgi:cytochrome c oxidase assembly protein subunit 15